MDYLPGYYPYWETTPGHWEQRYVIPRNWPCTDCYFHTSFMATVYWDRPTCIRYQNPELLKDGRVIASVVEQEGTPGEPGWVWRFYVTEPVEGDVTWKVETTDCPKVS